MKKNILYLKILLHPFILVWDTYNLPINYCRLFNTKLVNSLVFYSDLKTFYLLQMYTLDIRKLVIQMYHKLKSLRFVQSITNISKSSISVREIERKNIADQKMILTSTTT